MTGELEMPSNVRRYDNSCQEVWNTNKNVFQCLSCDSSEQLIICENCFRNGKHKEHKYKEITNFNGFCNCGDLSGLIFCANHQQVIIANISKPLHLNDWLLREFIQITAIEENEAKYLSHLNQIRKLFNQSSDGVLIKNYFDNSQAEGQRAIKIKKSFSVYRKDHEKRFVECGYDRQRRRLLWHGTKCSNLSGILMHGLKLSAKENLMFGNGVYFADRVTKSCNYCDQTGSGILLLCEVSLGAMYRTVTPKPYISVPDNYHTIKGLGKFKPDPNTQLTFDGSIEVPAGKTIENKLPKISFSELNFNEYIVFDPKRILIKFIVQFDWS